MKSSSKVLQTATSYQPITYILASSCLFVSHLQPTRSCLEGTPCIPSPLGIALALALTPRSPASPKGEPLCLSIVNIWLICTIGPQQLHWYPMNVSHVLLQVILAGCTMGAVLANKRLLPRVGHDVPPQVIRRPTVHIAEVAPERFFSPQPPCQHTLVLQ